MKNSTINPPPPTLDGLIWRPITRDDLTELVALAKACYLSDGGIHAMFEPDEIISRFFPDEPGAAIGALNADGQLVACNTVTVSGDLSTLRATIVGHVRPDMRGRGFGTYLMRWSQVQARDTCWLVPLLASRCCKFAPNHSQNQPTTCTWRMAFRVCLNHLLWSGTFTCRCHIVPCRLT